MLVVFGFLAGAYFGSSLESAGRKPAAGNATEPKKPAYGQGIALRPSLRQPTLEKNVRKFPGPTNHAPEASPVPSRLEAPSVSKAIPDASRLFSVQVGAFKVRSKAEKVAKRLKHYGFEPFLERYNAKDGLWYRVRTGRFKDLKKARAFLGRVLPRFKGAYVAKIDDELAIEEMDL